MGFVGAVLGLILGGGLAYYITFSLVKKSNDMGDSKGCLQDFGSIHMIEYMDNMMTTSVCDGHGRKILEERSKTKAYKRGITDRTNI